MRKEIAIGVVLGVLTWLAIDGVNVVPAVFILLLLAGLMFTGVLNRITLKNSRKVAVSRTMGITFNDIGGQSTAKGELIEALEFVLKPEKIEVLGIRPLKGILLTGPPGTGKTLLAKAAAQYTDSAFLASSGSEFVEMYAGVGAQRVRQLFTEARSLARREGRGSAIIFIDEIEVIAGRRGQHSSHLEYDQTLNQLLVELDGIDSHDDDVRLLLMAATNRADLLDAALLRPGRFDRSVRVDLPDRPGRLQILELHVRNKPLAQNVQLDRVAQETFGFSGAHLESLCNEAAIIALREGKPELDMEHFSQAIDKVLLGEKIDRALRREELQRVAVHEGGHAVVGELVSPGSVASITILPRGMALGFVRQSPEDDRLLQTITEMHHDIRVCLAGSAAERLLLGEASTGAANDFEKAWDIGKRMVLSGLSSLGIVHEEALSPDTLYRAVQEIIEHQQEVVDQLISDHRQAIERLAQRLLLDNSVTGDVVRDLIVI